MAAWYSRRAKASLAHKFASHIPCGQLEERVFVNNSDIYGHCQHVPSRYVYNRYSQKKLRALHRILSIDSHPELNGGTVPPFEEWLQALYDADHQALINSITHHNQN